MQFSRDWLAQYVEVGPVDELRALLTRSGSSVEHVTIEGDDALLDVDITGNRPDCMNHVGLAREIAVLRGVPLRRPDAAPSESGAAASSLARVEVAEARLCPRYSARLLEDVRLGPSPDWLVRRLETVGARSINNVVDVTNFVLWELGQPLHAFDLDTLGASTIVVRLAAAGEKLQTLDGVARELLATDLVIADAKRAVALAGVMGGLATEVTPATRRVLLESAHFDRSTVRRTAKRLGLHTDASHRFERGTDPEGTVAALDRAAVLLADIAGATVRRGVLDVVDPAVLVRREIAFSPRRLDGFAGVAYDRSELARWFTGLGLEVLDAGADTWKVRVPSWRRFDLERAEDLYEEAMRVRGFEAIPAALSPIYGSDGPETPVQKRRRLMRRHLVGQGFAETIQYSFVSREEDARYPLAKTNGKAPDAAAAGGFAASGPVELANPLSEQYTVLRRSMLPGLVATALFNLRRGAGAVRLFEIGNVFLEEEIESLGLVLGGTDGTPWDGAREADLYELKGVLDSLLEAFDASVEIRRAELPGVLSGTGAELYRDGEWAGWFGRLDCESAVPLLAAELFCRALGDGAAVSRVTTPSRFPGVAADLTLTHGTTVPWSAIARAIADAAPAELQAFDLKDRYQGEGVPAGAVNTTISFRYNAPDRSLQQEEVNARQAEIAKLLDQRFGWGAKETA
ncbi:MAG TPA: phenylalanine--tRNA ligase subunit beta [Thermoanaerobaculia bacterium]|nr:phenylalanine--tRNA ligase subunit beta [Thermoanaerobaculia bacterium]